MPHSVAKANISMYVNETGGVEELKQTVWTDPDQKKDVNYYFHTKQSGRMKKGDQLELLVAYLDTYSEIRERKGYGKRSRNIPSDDHFPTFLERQFAERFNMVEEIYLLEHFRDIQELVMSLEDIRFQLAGVVDSFVENVKSSSPNMEGPLARQIIALRRLNWLKPSLLTKIQSFGFDDPMVRQCREEVSKLDWASWPELIDMLEQNHTLVDGMGFNVREKFRAEVTEEICYGINRYLVFPCSSDTWCGMAAGLIEDLCSAVAKEHWDYSKDGPSSMLCKVLMQKAMEANDAIYSPMTQESLEKLSFSPNCWKRYCLTNRQVIKNAPDGTKCVLAVVGSTSYPEPVVLDELTDIANLSSRLHKKWYLCRQVIYIVNVFAHGYLSYQDREYFLQNLCSNLDIPLETVLDFLKESIALETGNDTVFYGDDFKHYVAGNQLKLAKVSCRTSVKKLVFRNVVWQVLEKQGWTLDRSDENAFYFCPPGVHGSQGFRRTDNVVAFLGRDEKYCTQAEILSAMEEYQKCLDAWKKLKARGRRAPLFGTKESLVAYLRKVVGATTDGSSDAAVDAD
mmetsp:Transcript_2132/g.3842  ORF Transcript_2132/g.3842 Transcript_2132/m.3842 type:complete len:568 (+) Transcript_2132:291-1994(+)